MPHARQITVDERRIVLRMRDEGYSPQEISVAIGRCRGTVYNIFNNPAQEAALLRSGRPRTYTDAAFRHMIRTARRGHSTARQARDAAGLDISVERARQLISSDPHLRFKRMRRAPFLTEVHKQRRVDWANTHVSWTAQEWNNVIWSDEKKFTLDGPDGCAYYWADRRCQERIFQKRNFGGGPLMVWGAFSSCGVSSLCFVDERLNAVRYCEILEQYLLNFAFANHGTEPGAFKFMHDGARPHTANYTKDYLASIPIEVIPWPACSPDVNPIENLWGYLTQIVYADSRHFQTKEQLKGALVNAWDSIPQQELDALNSSMRQRCIKLLQGNGKAIKY